MKQKFRPRNDRRIKQRGKGPMGEHVYGMCICFSAFSILAIMIILCVFFIVTRIPEQPPPLNIHPLILLQQLHIENSDGTFHVHYMVPEQRVEMYKGTTDHHSYSCGGGTYDYSIYMDHILSKLNHTIQSPPDQAFLKNYQDSDRSLNGRYNLNMNHFYQECVNHKEPIEIPNSFPVCGTKTLFWIKSHIERIQTKEEVISFFGRLQRCHFETPFQVQWADNFIHQRWEERKRVYYFTQNSMAEPERENKIQQKLYWFSKSSKSNEQECHLFSDLDEGINFPFSSLFHAAFQLSRPPKGYEILCTPSNGFLDYLNREIWHNKYFTVEDYKIMLRDIVKKTIQKRNTPTTKCLDEMIEYYPASYCRAAKARFIKMEKHLEMAEEEKEKFMKTIKKNLFLTHPIMECTDKVKRNLINDHLDKVIVAIGQCYNDYDHVYELEIQPYTSRIQFMFQSKAHQIYQPIDMHGVFSNRVRYEKARRMIHYPIPMIIERRFSMYYDPVSVYGTYDFAIGHEMAHAFFDILDPNEFQCMAQVMKKKSHKLTPYLTKEHLADYLSYQWVIARYNEDHKLTDDVKDRLESTIAQMLCNEIRDVNTAKSRVNVLHELRKTLYK